MRDSIDDNCVALAAGIEFCLSAVAEKLLCFLQRYLETYRKAEQSVAASNNTTLYATVSTTIGKLDFLPKMMLNVVKRS